MSRWLRSAALVVLVASTVTAPPAQAAAAHPTLTVSVVEDGLDIPWDVTFLPPIGSAIPTGSMLYSERSLKRLTLRLPSGEKRVILDNPAGMWSSGETGLMSVEPAKDFASTREFLTCHGYKSGATQDVRVVRWRFNDTFTGADKVRTLLKGLPSTSGRHGGCALTKGGHDILYVGTGDAATGRNPQYRGSGGGKVLRIDSRTGDPIRDNPWIRSANAVKRKLTSYGHRNVQGLARRKDGTIWSVEHGSYRDDEVNRVRRGSNFGWNPVRRRSGDPAYNEGANSPMTDYSLPGKQTGARWRSGSSTIAASGATFVYGSGWGAWNGALAVTALKDSSLRLMTFSSGGTYRKGWKARALNGTHGRLRGAALGPDGALYLTTSNGGGDDKILKVTPS